MTFASIPTSAAVFADANTLIYHFCQGDTAMPLTIEAVYENGVLKPAQPLPLKEHEKVTVTIEPKSGWVEETYGICGWKGSAEEADFFAMDPELDYPPPPEEP
jgi:predicted DNA-binding antitoxin AbrB/MazE fold protein